MFKTLKRKITRTMTGSLAAIAFLPVLMYGCGGGPSGDTNFIKYNYSFRDPNSTDVCVYSCDLYTVPEYNLFRCYAYRVHTYYLERQPTNERCYS